MDGYMHNLDPYRQASAGYYAPRYPHSYALERRSSFGLPSADTLSSYARVPLDPFAGYGASAAPYQPEIVLQPRYVSAPRSPPFRSRPRPGPRPFPKKKGVPSQNLGPKKKPFKQTQKVRFSEEKERPSSKKDAPRKAPQPAKKNDQSDTKATPASQAASLAKETKELHSLFRTGVDTNKAENSEGKRGDANGTAKKRKADSQMQKPTSTKNSKNAKKQKGKKKKKLAKEKKVKVEKVELPPPTEAELKEAEAALEVQRGLCHSVCQFLGIPETIEAVVADVEEPVGKVDDSKETEKDSKESEKDVKEMEKKLDEPQRTPEEEKEAESKSFKFFSSVFAEHLELRNLYIDKCNAGSFECLVCRSVDSTKSKIFWTVASLVMHTKMRKQMRPEHSGYGRAICAALGWDHEKTPKVPRGTRPAKAADQGKDTTEQEPVEKADQDQKETEKNVTEEKGEEIASECPPVDAKED